MSSEEKKYIDTKNRIHEYINNLVIPEQVKYQKIYLNMTKIILPLKCREKKGSTWIISLFNIDF